ncbi:MAG: hypothetical protein RI911_760 [Candidatus Parcubacteria bacterium]|jgi:DNA-binding MarR family transcriptional regulator
MAKQSESLVSQLRDARRQVQVLTGRFEERAAEVFPEGSRVTGSQALVILALAEKAGVSQTHLVEVTHIDRSTLADITRRLVKRGVIVRRRSKSDARAYILNLTEEGKKAVRLINSM